MRVHDFAFHADVLVLSLGLQLLAYAYNDTYASGRYEYILTHGLSAASALGDRPSHLAT